MYVLNNDVLAFNCKYIAATECLHLTFLGVSSLQDMNQSVELLIAMLGLTFARQFLQAL